MYNVLSAKNHLCSILFAFALIAISCTDPNSIGGPTNVTGTGTGVNLLDPQNRVVNGILIAGPTADGLALVGFAAPFHSAFFRDSTRGLVGVSITRSKNYGMVVQGKPFSRDLVVNAQIDSSLKITEAYINMTEKTFRLQEPSGIVPGFVTLFWSNLQYEPGFTLPSSAQQVNVYLENFPIENNNITMPPAISILSPKIEGSTIPTVQRSAGVIIEWDTPISSSDSEMYAEVSIMGNAKDFAFTVPRTDINGIFKSIPNGAQKITFSAAELSKLPADFAIASISVRRLKITNKKTVFIETISHSNIQLKLQ